MPDLILYACPNGVLVSYDETRAGEVIVGGTQWPRALDRVNNALGHVFVRLSPHLEPKSV